MILSHSTARAHVHEQPGNVRKAGTRHVRRHRRACGGKEIIIKKRQRSPPGASSSSCSFDLHRLSVDASCHPCPLDCAPTPGLTDLSVVRWTSEPTPAPSVLTLCRTGRTGGQRGSQTCRNRAPATRNLPLPDLWPQLAPAVRLGSSHGGSSSCSGPLLA